MTYEPPPVHRWTEGDVEHTSQRFTLRSIFDELFGRRPEPTMPTPRRRIRITETTRTIEIEDYC